MLIFISSDHTPGERVSVLRPILSILNYPERYYISNSESSLIKVVFTSLLLCNKLYKLSSLKTPDVS